MRFYLPLVIRHHTRRYGGADLVRILTLCWLLQFSQDSVYGLQYEWGVPEGLILVTRNCRGGKIISPLPFMVGAWLGPLFSLGYLVSG